MQKYASICQIICQKILHCLYSAYSAYCYMQNMQNMQWNVADIFCILSIFQHIFLHILSYFLAFSFIFFGIFCILFNIYFYIFSFISLHIFWHIFWHILAYFLAYSAYYFTYICKIWWIFRPDRSVPGVRVGFIEFSNEARNRKPFRKHMHRAPAHSERILEVTPAAGTALEAAPVPSPVPEPFCAIQAFHPSLRSLAACSSRCSALTSSRLAIQQSSGNSILSLKSSACDLEEKGRNQKRSSMKA